MDEQNWDAKEYAKYSKGQEKWAKELILKLDLKGDETILDIGCGDGKITQRLSKATTSRVVGVDKSKSMIDLASKSYPNITFICLDATKLNFEKEFDIVFSNAVLHWIDDHRSLLQGIKEALKPDGRALLQFGGGDNAKVILDVMELFIKNSKYAHYFKDFEFPYFFPKKDEYEKLLDQVGFKNYTVLLIPKEMLHEDLEAFKGWIRTTWFPYTDCLPLALKEEFIDEFATSYLKDVPPKDGKISVYMERIEVNIQNY